MDNREKLDKLRGRTNQKGQDIVMYSYKMSEHDHYNQHELVRLEHSISSFCLLYTSPSPRDRQKSRMPSSA